MTLVSASVLPLKRYADFRGRSTRTELVAFWFLVMLAQLLIESGARAAGSPEAIRWLDTGLLILVAVPALAVCVRRMHDAGRSGWWLLIVSPWVPATVWEFVARPRPWALPIQLNHPWWVMLPLGLCTFLLCAFMILEDDDVDANPYGPNPRGWMPPAGEPA